MTATETAPVPASIPANPAAPELCFDRMIEIRQGALGPKAVIAGHSIRVDKLAQWHEELGMSVEQILESYPELSRAKIHAALAYFYEHEEEMRAKIASDEEFVEEMMAKAPPSPLRYIMNRMEAGLTQEQAIAEARQTGLLKPEVAK